MRIPFIATAALVLFSLGPAFGQEGETGTGEGGGGRPAPEIRIIGNEEISESRLRQVASRELGTFADGSGRPADLADAAYVMESWIREQGYPTATVTFRMIDVRPEGGQTLVRSAAEWDQVDLVEFVIEEGRKAILGEVRFPGASAFDEDRLREFVPRGGLSAALPPTGGVTFRRP